MAEQQQLLALWLDRAAKVTERAGLQDLEAKCLGTKEAVLASNTFDDASFEFYADIVNQLAVQIIAEMPL